VISSKQPVAGKNLLDGLAIGASLTCMVHCLALPILIALLPAWSAWLDMPEAIHVWALAFTAPFSLAVLLRAARFRPGYPPLWLAALGLSLMGLALLVGGKLVEPIVTSLGAILLAAAHVMNLRCRSR